MISTNYKFSKFQLQNFSEEDLQLLAKYYQIPYKKGEVAKKKLINQILQRQLTYISTDEVTGENIIEPTMSVRVQRIYDSLKGE